MPSSSVEALPFSLELQYPEPISDTIIPPTPGPCPSPEGYEKRFGSGSVFEIQSDTNVYTVVKKGPDKKRVIARNMVVAIEDTDQGDEVWVLPENPGKKDRSQRYRLMHDGHLEISLFNGKVTTAEFDIISGLKKPTETPVDSDLPESLPTRKIGEILTTMVTLIQNQPYELSEIQSFINLPRDNKLEDF